MRTFLYPIVGESLAWKVVDRNPFDVGMGHGVRVEDDEICVTLVRINEKHTIQREPNTELVEYEELTNGCASPPGVVLPTHLLPDLIDALKTAQEDIYGG